MGYDGKIREKLKLVRLNNKKIEYELSNLLSPNCRTFTALKKDEIINYVDEYYFRKNQIDYDNLINDINVFKSYRDDVDINVRKENDFNQLVTIVIAIMTIFTSNLKGDNAYINIIIFIFKFIFFLLLAVMVSKYYLIINGSHSESNKLKVINNVIYTLEAIKEDMDKKGNASMKYTEINSNVNDNQSDDKTEEISTKAKSFTENDEDSYEGLELTEVKEIRTYTYKARKNKYSPRAMYERKRR